MAEILDALFDEYRANRSPLSNYGMERSRSKKSPKTCVNCNRTEGMTEMFKICRRCKQLKVSKSHPMYHHYCCKACQTEHWKVHRFEHTEYERHHGPYIDNERLSEFCGFRRRFRFRFDKICKYTREQVIKILIDHIGKPNLLSIFAIERGRFWIADMKDGPHIQLIQCEGVKHNKDGYKFKTFPLLLDNDHLYPQNDKQGKQHGHAEDKGLPKSEISDDEASNTMQVFFDKNRDLERSDVADILIAKYGIEGVTELFALEEPGVWIISVRKQWQVNELLNEGLEYKADGVTYRACAKYIG